MTQYPPRSLLSARLAALSYDDGADEFVRFVDNPNDELVASVVRAVALGNDNDRESFCAVLDDAMVNTLLLYAQRRTLQAKRRASINLVDEAIAGFALQPNANDVPWDSWLKAALFIGKSLGRDSSALNNQFSELARASVTSRFAIAFESMNRVSSLGDCRITEVSTTYGSGFVETLVFRDSSSPGFATGFTPRRPDDHVIFRPRSNIAQLAVSFANGLDATNVFSTSHIVQDQVAAMPFDLKIAGSFLPTTGCLSFFADSTIGGVSFKAFVAELEDEFEVDNIASVLLSIGQGVFIDDHRLIFLLANPSFDGDEQAAFKTSDFVLVAQSAFADSDSSRWSAL